MTWLEFWTLTPLAKALGWTLLHSLWEGAAIALLLAAALCALHSSRARYGAACVALLAMLAAFAITLARLWPPSAPFGAHGVVALAQVPQVEPAPFDLSAPYRLRAVDLLPWLAPFWLLGVLLFQLRVLAGWTAARRLRRSGVCCAAAEWTARLDRLAARVRVSRPVTLFESSLADAPVVIGYLRPVILMPVGLLAGLPVAQVEAILAHELAHIGRQDYLVNLMQTFVEGLLFYHPAVWWISRQIRVERENCCDDLAVAVSGDARTYAAALAALEQSRWTARELALAATGGNLVKRIRRLLETPDRPRAGFAPLASAVVLIAVTAAGLAAWETTPAAKPQQSAPRVSAPVASVPSAAQAKPEALAPAVQSRQVKTRGQLAEVAALQDQPRDQPQDQTSDVLRKLADELQQNQAPKPAKSPAAPYTKWLNQDVAYIITDQERATFKALTTDADRESFIEQFWQIRDPTPGTSENEFKVEHYRRIAYANEHFAPTTATPIPGWKTDRGRIYITYGPPDEIEDHSSGGTYQRPPAEGGGQTETYPFQQWRYRYIEGVGQNVVIEFVDPTYTHEYRMTMDPSEKDALALVTPPATQAGAFQRIEGSKALSFISVGGDPQLTIEAGANGLVSVRVEQNPIAGEWNFALAVTSGGKTVANARDSVRLATPSALSRFPYNTGFRLAAGSYTLNVAVKDPTGAIQTKSLAFYVN